MHEDYRRRSKLCALRADQGAQKVKKEIDSLNRQMFKQKMGVEKQPDESEQKANKDFQKMVQKEMWLVKQELLTKIYENSQGVVQAQLSREATVVKGLKEVTACLGDVLKIQKEITSQHEDLGKSVSMGGGKFQNIEKSKNPFAKDAQQYIDNNTNQVESMVQKAQKLLGEAVSKLDHITKTVEKNSNKLKHSFEEDIEKLFIQLGEEKVEFNMLQCYQIGKTPSGMEA